MLGKEAGKRYLQQCSPLWEKPMCPNVLVYYAAGRDFQCLLWALQMFLASCLKELL